MNFAKKYAFYTNNTICKWELDDVGKEQFIHVYKACPVPERGGAEFSCTRKEKMMNDKVTLKEKFSYALANLGNIPIQTLIGSYLLIFYTNVVGLDPAACATLFLIARVLDGLNDPFVGFAIDHIPTTRFGHFRPTLIVGTIFCSLNFLLLWFGPLLAPGGKLVIAYISYILIGVLFPVMDISLNSMLPVMTEDMNERNFLSSLKGTVYMLGMFVLNMIAPLIIGDTSEAGGYITLITGATIAIAVLSIVGAIGMRERVRVEAGSGNKYGLKDLIRILTQRPVWATFLSSLLYTVGLYILNTTNTYFFTYVLDNLALLSVSSIVQLVALLPATMMSAMFIRKYGKKKVFLAGMILYGALPLIRLFDVMNVPLIMVATALSGFGNGLCMPLTYGIQADNTDYVELKLGHRAEAAVAALSSFVTKCAMGIGGAIPGYLLAAVGFNAAAETQPEIVNTVIIGCVLVAPAVLCVLGAVIFGAAYPLTREKLDEQVKLIQQKRAQQ